MLTEACECGVRFAIGLLRCPRCQKVAPRFANRVKEDQMPRITVAGGPTNPDALPGEVGYIGPVDAAPAAVVVVEDGQRPEVADLPPGGYVEPADAAPSAPDYASMTQAALREQAKGRGLPVGGAKADLAARLAAHDATSNPEGGD